MDRLTAERIAAAAAGVTLEQAQAVIDQLIQELRRCAVCEDTGRFTIDEGIDVNIWYKGAHGPTAAYLPSGVETQCPRCRTGEGDPAFVKWFCRSGMQKDKCLDARTENPEQHRHDTCGWRVLLPIPGREPVPPPTAETVAADTDGGGSAPGSQ